jgi:hypothetical protein
MNLSQIVSNMHAKMPGQIDPPLGRKEHDAQTVERPIAGIPVAARA